MKKKVPKRTLRGGWVNPKKLEKGPNGRNLCRWCNQEVGKGRRTFCSDACVTEHKIRTQPEFLRECVLTRDKGICAICGFDTEKIKRILFHAVQSYCRGSGLGESYGRFYRKVPSWRIRQLFGKVLETLCLPANRSSYWDADHIVPVVEGGGQCGLDNIRTLCIDCHKQVTRELRGRMKEQNQKDKQI